jgi:hypothetical protein
MGTTRAQRLFMYAVLAAATLVAALEVTAARGGDPTPKPETPWLAPLGHGVDGYPITRGNIHLGDTVEAIQEKHGEEWVTTKVRVLGPAPRPGPGRC